MQSRPGLGLRLEAFGALGYRVLALVCALGAGILVARFLGPANKGALALLVLGPETLARLAEIGLVGASVYGLGRKRVTLGQVHGNLLKLVAGATVVLLAGYLVFGVAPLAAWWPELPPAYLRVALLLAPLALYVFVWQGVMAGVGEQRRAQRTLCGAQVAWLAGVVALVLADAPLWTYVALIAGVFVVRALGAARLFLRAGDNGAPRIQRGGLRAALRFGGVVYAGALLAHLLYRVDQFVVAEQLGMEAIGWYSLAATLAEYPWIVTTVILNSVLHLIASGDEKEAATAACEAARQALLLGLAALVGAVLLAEPVVVLLYSGAFRPSVTPLLLLLPGVVAIAVAQSLLAWLTYRRGKPGWSALAVLGGVAVHLPLLFWLVPRHGIVGAACASTAGYVAVLAGALALFVRHSGCSVRDVLMPRASDFAAYGRLLRDLRRLLRREARADA